MQVEKLPLGRPFPSTEMLPAVTVSNEVAWVNSNLNIPFDIRLGQSCDLGMLFLMRNRKPETIPKTFTLDIMDGHNRSGLLGRIVLSDKAGNIYRDVDIKGTGMFGYCIHEDGRDNAPRGLFTLRHAINEAEVTEKLHASGLLAYRVAAIMKLNQLLDEESQPRSIEWFINHRIINPDRAPVVSVRAFVVKTRLGNIDFGDLDGTNISKNQVSPQFLDGLTFINQRYHVALDLQNPLDYLKWLAAITGRQLTLFQQLGWFHGSLSQHNVTIDGRLVDYATVRKAESPSDFSADYLRLRQTLMELGETISAPAVKETLEIFERSYKIGNMQNKML